MYTRAVGRSFLIPTSHASIIVSLVASTTMQLPLTMFSGTTCLSRRPERLVCVIAHIAVWIASLTINSGWKCCKPRVLTFDEFMTIPPCTTGKHSTVDDTPAPEAKPDDEDVEAKIRAQKEKNDNLQPAVARNPVTAQPPRPTPSPAPPEEEDDDPDTPVPDGATCKRRGCGGTYTAGQDRNPVSYTHLTLPTKRIV